MSDGGHPIGFFLFECLFQRLVLFLHGFYLVVEFGEFDLIAVEIVQDRLLIGDKLETFFFLLIVSFDVTVVFGLLFFQLLLNCRELGIRDFEINFKFFYLFLSFKFILLKFGDLVSELGVFLVESFDGGPLGGGVILSHWERNLLNLIKCMKDRIQNLKFLFYE